MFRVRPVVRFIDGESPAPQVELFFDADVLSQLRCIQNQTAYDVTLSGINAWFEAIWVEPHVSYECCRLDYV